MKKIQSNQLKKGMLVRVNEHWLKTPFFTNKVKIKSEGDKHKLKQFEGSLYVSEDKSVGALNKGLSILKVALEDCGQSDVLNNKAITQAVTNIVLFVLNDASRLDLIYEKISEDSQSFRESVRLLVLITLFSKEIKLRKDKLIPFAKSAFLKDIGMSLIPPDYKQSKQLSAKAIDSVHEHIVLGCRELQSRGIEDNVIKIIKCHHENCDGSGYPHGLIKPEIPLEARIIRIIDTYVALTSQRHYREKFSRVEAIEKVYHAAQIGKFDHILTTKFINFIRLYPKGAKVELNDKSQAIVNKDLANGTVELADSHTVEKSIVDKVNIAKCLWFI
ncbi:HD-GYP domain-containing protein [Pseudoalteromonas sp. JSTW]|uniref:HD-GYP domain-containing protein n=1 Tax=Pseudoalteromonas sp. JSTW TaxID=2752475 RepID=UPI0015D531B8|nr:HD-GYP domain-containing protein [Pseudoalteromonas sp. JSTW]QLJ10158.1 DUF3391 domain-containing protein [Pseudoalteromonas sp. JSTW]